jgi:perosamine synthetase
VSVVALQDARVSGTPDLPEDQLKRAHKKRERLMKFLVEESNVGTVVANPPVYTYNKFIRQHTKGQSAPLSEEIASRLFCPTLHPLMTKGQNEYVATAILDVVERLRSED